MPNDKEQKISPEEGAEEKKYSFLQETIKVKPVGREQLVRQLVRIAVYGLILGVFACFGFFALKPWMENWFADDPKTVTITNDEQLAEIQPQNGTENGKNPALDAEIYEEMTAGMNERAKEAQNSMVSISAVSEDKDWNGEMTGILRSVTGVIIGDNGQELLVLADSSICTDSAEWKATFANGKRFDAVLKQQDHNRRLAVFGVRESSLDDATQQSVKVAALGNSKLVTQGEAVIALGNVFGYAGGMSYGVVSSSNYKASFFDGECDVIATDIPIEEKGTGVLFNMDGEVVGLISTSVWNDTGKNVANAYGISDLKPLIELLVNGKIVPYIGIHGTTVTKQLAEEHGMPQGIYVVDIDPNSPAMAAGIQTGDIICSVAGEDITNIVTYQNAVLNETVGELTELDGKRLGSDGYVDVVFAVVTGLKK